MISICICATKSYAYAMTEQARRIQANCFQLEPGAVIIAGDDSPEVKAAVAAYRRMLPKWTVEHLVVPGAVDGMSQAHNYQPPGQTTIARLRTAAFTRARELGSSQCWSLDSDVLPPANALRCMQTMLAFDDGYYGVATCPYVSQSGGGWLFGRGTPQHAICQDFYEDERLIPEDLAKELKDLRELLNTPVKRDELTAELKEKLQKSMDQLREAEKKIDECPVKGNVWMMNGIKWRMRGWGDQAYPGVGKGSVLPTDWCGFGCTLMSQRALAAADFGGYQGGGTEDLYIVWQKWFPLNIRICSILHCLCDHIVRNRGDDKEQHPYIHCIGYHQPNGEDVGHLRVRRVPWLPMELPDNNGANQ